MDAGLAVACVSLLLSAGSIGWQAASWKLDGGRVRVRLVHGTLGSGGVASGPVGRDGSRRDLRLSRSSGFNGPEVVGIAVTNVGRASVRVDRYAVELGRREGGFTPLADAIGQP